MGGFSGTRCTLYTVTLYIVHNIKYRTKNVIQNIQITKRLYMGHSSPIKSATAKYDIQDEELQNILKFFTWVARLLSSRPLLAVEVDNAAREWLRACKVQKSINANESSIFAEEG